MGPWPREGPRVTLSVLFFIFCRLGTRVKAACRTKRGPSQNFRTLFLSFIDPFSSGVGSLLLLGALKHELSPLRSKMGPVPKSDIFVICYLLFFLVCDFGPLPKNSGPNPMSFPFMVWVTLGPHERWPPPWENPGYATGRACALHGLSVAVPDIIEARGAGGVRLTSSETADRRRRRPPPLHTPPPPLPPPPPPRPPRPLRMPPRRRQTTRSGEPLRSSPLVLPPL